MKKHLTKKTKGDIVIVFQEGTAKKNKEGKRLTKKTKGDIVIVFQEGTAKKNKEGKRLIKNENRQTKKVYFNGGYGDLSTKFW